jgi:hypothetical protein
MPIPKYSQDELTHFSAEPMYKEHYNDRGIAPFGKLGLV